LFAVNADYKFGVISRVLQTIEPVTATFTELRIVTQRRRSYK
jgi:hypothetical protein